MMSDVTAITKERPGVWVDAPLEFAPMPFWFWNDDLHEGELTRQLDDFLAHGVGGVVIHPRVGLPRSIGWMSQRMLGLVRFTVEAAAARGMRVILYDEGMYPSGSSCGQVVAENSTYACRCLARIELQPGESPQLPASANLLGIFDLAGGRRMAVIDRPVDACIRGLHYIGEGPAEDEPPAGDLLNPEAVSCFIRLVYGRFYSCVGDHFGKTVMGIFTDEPSMLGRCREKDVVPGTAGILEHVSRMLGYDFTPHLPALWRDDVPDARLHRDAYHRAVRARLEETFYRPLHDWCESHGVALMGHPAEPTDIGMERYFHVPGQDLVWRNVMPAAASALEGAQSTQAKCSSSAMIHQGRRRNSNEFCGAYGHELTFAEMKWLADWCLIRGANLLIPHAFYYSVRGFRRDERPPDVGPNSAWWGEYKPFADHVRRVCWMNTDSRHVCSVAILSDADSLPWAAAKVCFENQIDFNYLERRDLLEAELSPAGVAIAGMRYGVLVVDAVGLDGAGELGARLAALASAGRLVMYGSEPAVPPGSIAAPDPRSLCDAIIAIEPRGISLAPASADMRVRRATKEGFDFVMLFNESTHRLEVSVDFGSPGPWQEINTQSGALLPLAIGGLVFEPFAFRVLCCRRER